jgi:hypothetical protein
LRKDAKAKSTIKTVPAIISLSHNVGDVNGDISDLVEANIGISIKQSITSDQMPDMNCEGEYKNVAKVL